MHACASVCALVCAAVQAHDQLAWGLPAINHFQHASVKHHNLGLFQLLIRGGSTPPFTGTGKNRRAHSMVRLAWPTRRLVRGLSSALAGSHYSCTRVLVATSCVSSSLRRGARPYTSHECHSAGESASACCDVAVFLAAPRAPAPHLPCHAVPCLARAPALCAAAPPHATDCVGSTPTGACHPSALAGTAAAIRALAPRRDPAHDPDNLPHDGRGHGRGGAPVAVRRRGRRT